MNKVVNGVTLVEMMVAIGIIALLAILILPGVKQLERHSRQRAARALLNILDVALMEYHEDQGTYPAAMFDDVYMRNESMFDQLQAIPASEQILNKIRREYKRNLYPKPVPNNSFELYDPWDTILDYQYNAATHNYPRIISAGPDKQFGTDDDITNRK